MEVEILFLCHLNPYTFITSINILLVASIGILVDGSKTFYREGNYLVLKSKVPKFYRFFIDVYKNRPQKIDGF